MLALKKIKMNIKIFPARQSPELKLTFKIIFFIFLLFILYLVGNYYFVRWSTINNLKKGIKTTINQVKKDLKYKDGQWNTYSYVNNPEISYDNPLYIFTIDGFLIDRIKPINGFLDTSIFDYALKFDKPQTYTSEINERWRILYYPIERDGQIQAALLPGYFDPPESAASEIDQQLLNNAKKIDSKIKYVNGKLDVTEVESSTPYELIDRFNKVLKSEGGIPAYIDRSFVQKTIEVKEAIIKDEKTGEPYFVISDSIHDNNQSLIGIVAAARSYKNTQEYLKSQVFFTLGSALVAIFLVAIFSIYVFGREIPSIIKMKLTQLIEPKDVVFESISFDPKSSVVKIDKETIDIPADTNQYYLLKALFSTPNKKWENDELVEKIEGLGFGEGNPRKFYDSAKAINHKLKHKIGTDLIIYKARAFQLTPEIASKIS